MCILGGISLHKGLRKVLDRKILFADMEEYRIFVEDFLFVLSNEGLWRILFRLRGGVHKYLSGVLNRKTVFTDGIFKGGYYLWSDGTSHPDTVEMMMVYFRD